MLNARRCLALLLLAIAASPAVAHAQSWRDQLDRQITRSDLLASLTSAGYGTAHDVRYGTLRPGLDTSVVISLAAGSRYAFVGLCDDDCGDLDLHLYDATGALVEEDIAADDVPIVTVDDSRAGSYVLRIVMASCRTSFCGWALVTPSPSAGRIAHHAGAGAATLLRDR